MRMFILALLLGIITFSANAQSENSLIYKNAISKYSQMERTGMALTIIGGATLFTGNVLYWKTFNNQTNGQPNENKADKYRKIMIGGLGIMAVAIPLWAINKSKERHIQIEARLVNFKGLASANGIGFNIRF
jgi:hypothetical protein